MLENGIPDGWFHGLRWILRSFVKKNPIKQTKTTYREISQNLEAMEMVANGFISV